MNGMHLNYLDFEQPIAELQAKIDELRRVGQQSDLNLTEEIATLEQRRNELTKNTFANLTDWQISQLARHPLRPHATDWIKNIFTDFDELHGDRQFSDDAAIVGGTARLNNKPVMIVGQEKGRDTKDKLKRNFGMPNPDGYRKALRLFKLAEKFNMPIITLIDTPGAYPGVGAEERGQGEAIARNLLEMSQLKVPVICLVTGEGCSGGALGIGVGDSLLMLEYSTFSVISPEGCATILFKSAEKAKDAAEMMQMTAHKLKKLGLINDIVSEPLGGAHRSYEDASQNVRDALIKTLDGLLALSVEELLAKRYDRLMSLGSFKTS